MIVKNEITFILGETTGLCFPASCSSSAQWPILRGNFPEWIPDPTELPPLITVPAPPWGRASWGPSPGLWGLLWELQIVRIQKKKPRKKESDKCYRKTEQRGSTGVSVGVSLSCSWMCKHLALALLQWPGLSWHQARLGMRKQLQKHEVNRDVPALSCSALTLIDTLASNRIFSSPFQCMSWESWELGIHKQDLNSQRKSSSPQSPIPSGSSLPRWQSSSVNSSLHPGD